jgi:hypothetical protein
MRYQWRDLRCSIIEGSDGRDARLRSTREGDGEIIEESRDEGHCCQYVWESYDPRWRELTRLPLSDYKRRRRSL